MMSAFTLLFAAALLSIVLHRSFWLKPFALVTLGASFFYTLSGASVMLGGFSTNEHSKLFELILEIVLFAYVLNESEDTTITQTLFLGASSVLLLQAETLLSFVISFESLSLISVVLVSFIKTKEQAEGAVKMFIAGSLATGILFLGLVFYVMGGGVLLAPLSADSSLFMSIGVFIMLASLFYKLTIVPFHGWALDTYALVRHSHAGLLSGVAKTVAALAIFKIFSPFILEHIEFSMPLLATLAIVTMTLGNVLALFSKNIAKILSYSSVAHAGYILVAFVAVKSSFASDGILYMSIAYIFMQSGAFLLLDILKKNYNIKSLEDIKGLGVHKPILAFFFTLQLLSLAGIPLLAGFLGKAVVFYAGVDAGLWWLVLIALLNSALSVAYYAWIIKHIYFDESKIKDVLISIPLPLIAQGILAAGTIFFGIFAGTVL